MSAIFGMHNEPGLPVGEFATRGGAFYANVDRFVFKVTGKGAHAARPHEGKDAILLASQLVTVLQSVASREVNTLDSVVLSVTRIREAIRNVLPESVELEGTLRTHSSEVQQRVKARVSEIAAGFASAFGAQIDVFWYAGPTALVNDARWADFASDVAASRVPHPSRRSASRWRRFCGLSSAYSRGVRQHRQRQRIWSAPSGI